MGFQWEMDLVGALRSKFKITRSFEKRQKRKKKTVKREFTRKIGFRFWFSLKQITVNTCHFL